MGNQLWTSTGNKILIRVSLKENQRNRANEYQYFFKQLCCIDGKEVDDKGSEVKGFVYILFGRVKNVRNNSTFMCQKECIFLAENVKEIEPS